FGQVLVVTGGDKFELAYKIKPELLPAKIKYASYFVYKLPSDGSKFEFPLVVSDKRDEYGYTNKYIYLVRPPNTPFIGQKFDENSDSPLSRHKLSSLPQQRTDGWMEVKAWEFESMHSTTVSMHLKLEHPVQKDLTGLIIYGIELRPI
ncbi:kinase-like domain, phloem protein 2-like protein, partial [Tanacetum coccineum]